MGKPLDEKLYYKIRLLRDALVKPAVKLLAFLKIKSDWLSFFGLFCAMIFVYFLKTNKAMALYFLALALIMDVLDGGLARYLKIDSDQGKFTDTLIDNLVFSIFVIGLVSSSIISGLTGAIYVYATLLARVLAVIKRNVGTETDWLIRPMSGFFANIFAYLSYILFALYVLGGPNYLEGASIAFSLLLIFKAVTDYFGIKSTILTK